MSTILETELGQIEYAITGKGQPILFLHDGHSSCNETLFHKGYISAVTKKWLTPQDDFYKRGTYFGLEKKVNILFST